MNMCEIVDTLWQNCISFVGLVLLYADNSLAATTASSMALYIGSQNVSNELRRNLIVFGDSIVLYLQSDFDVITAAYGDEQYVRLRYGRLGQPERITKTHDAVQDILNSLIEDPSEGFTCVHGGRKYLKCHPYLLATAQISRKLNISRSVSMSHGQQAHVIVATLSSTVLETIRYLNSVEFILSFASWIQQTLSYPCSINNKSCLGGGVQKRAELKATCPFHTWTHIYRVKPCSS